MLDRLTPLAESAAGMVPRCGKLARRALFRAALEWLTATASRFGLAIDERTVLGLMATLLVVLLALVLWRRAIVRRRRPRVADTAPPLSRVVRTPRLIGYAATGRLLRRLRQLGGALASGECGGLARRGQPGRQPQDRRPSRGRHRPRARGSRRRVVRAGQMLVTLEDVQARAEFESLRERFVHLVTLEARLLAELVDDAAIERPASLERFPTRR